MKTIYLAGGCFGAWASISPGFSAFFRLPWDMPTATKNPTYEEVCRKNTGHAETVELRYDPNRVSLETLICQYFKNHRSHRGGQAGNDRGRQYRTGIYYTEEAERAFISAMLQEEQKTPGPHCGGMPPAGKVLSRRGIPPGVPEKNPDGCHISFESLKDLEAEKQAYPKPTPEEIRLRLTSEQFNVTQNAATERPFSGDYWYHMVPGLYVDIVTGERCLRPWINSIPAAAGPASPSWWPGTP